MRSRRKLLVTSAAALSVSATHSVAGFKSQEPTIKEVQKAVARGIDDSGPKGGKEAMQDLGIDARVQTTQDFQVNEHALETVEKGAKDGEFHAEYAFEDPRDSDSEFSLITGDAASEEEVYITPHMHLDGCSTTTRNSWWVDDAIGVGFTGEDWAEVGEPSVTIDDPHEARFTSENVEDDATAGTISIEADEAVCASLESGDAFLTAKYRLREDKVPSTLWGSYSHTIGGSPYSSIESISGGKGGLGLSLSFSGNTYWSIAKPFDPEEYL